MDQYIWHKAAAKKYSLSKADQPDAPEKTAYELA